MVIPLGGIALLATTVFVMSLMVIIIHPSFRPSWISAYQSKESSTPINYYLSQSLSEDLQGRLQSLLHAPVNDAFEVRDLNELACPAEVANHHYSLDRHWRVFWTWAGIGKDEIIRRRIGIAKYLEGVAREDLLNPKSYLGRGIVMTGGNKVWSPPLSRPPAHHLSSLRHLTQDTTRRLLVTLRILRKEYNCTLPVEIFSFPGEISDQDILAELTSLSASVHEVRRYPLPIQKSAT